MAGIFSKNFPKKFFFLFIWFNHLMIDSIKSNQKYSIFLYEKFQLWNFKFHFFSTISFHFILSIIFVVVVVIVRQQLPKKKNNFRLLLLLFQVFLSCLVVNLFGFVVYIYVQQVSKCVVLFCLYLVNTENV